MEFRLTSSHASLSFLSNSVMAFWRSCDKLPLLGLGLHSSHPTPHRGFAQRLPAALALHAGGLVVGTAVADAATNERPAGSSGWQDWRWFAAYGVGLIAAGAVDLVDVLSKGGAIGVCTMRAYCSERFTKRAEVPML